MTVSILESNDTLYSTEIIHEFQTVHLKKSCDDETYKGINNANIIFSEVGFESKEKCKEKCRDASDCKSISWYVGTKRCVVNKIECKNPKRVTDTPSSYNYVEIKPCQKIIPDCIEKTVKELKDSSSTTNNSDVSRLSTSISKCIPEYISCMN